MAASSAHRQPSPLFEPLEQRLLLDGSVLPAPDAFEPNDTLGTATDISAALIGGGGSWNTSDLSIHRESDQDWFRFEAPPNTDGNFTVTVSNLRTGLRGSVTVYRETGSRLRPVGRGWFGLRGNEMQLRVADATPGTMYYVRVDNFRKETGPYDIEMSLDLAQEEKDAFEGAGRWGNEQPRGASALDTDDLPQGPVGALSIHKAADVDWYRFTVPYGTTGTATLRMQNVANGLQGHLSLYDSTRRNAQPLQEASGAGPDQPVTLNAVGLVAGKTYYIEARGLNNTAGLYDLSLAIDMLDPDGPEVNDTSGTATNVTAPVLDAGGVWQAQNLSVHLPADHDWFRFDTPANVDGNFVVTVDNVAGGLSGSVNVYQDTGGVLRSAGRGWIGRRGPTTTVSVPGMAPGATYYVQVYNFRNETGTYDLRLEVPLTTQPLDALEGGRWRNDTARGAAPINVSGDAPTEVGDLTIHKAEDVDWYRFRLPAYAMGHFGCVMDNVTGGLMGRLKLYDSPRGSTPVEEASSALPNQKLTLGEGGLRPGATYYLEVSGTNGTSGTYTLTLDTPAFQPDVYEPSNTAETAHDLGLDVVPVFGGDNDSGLLAPLTFHTPADVDWFRWTVPEASDRWVVIDLKGQGRFIVTTYHDVGGRLVRAPSYRYRHLLVGADRAGMSGLVPDDTYYFQVRPAGRAFGAYSMTARSSLWTEEPDLFEQDPVDDPDPGFSNAPLLPLPDPDPITFQGLTMHSRKDHDRFLLPVPPEGKQLRITIRNFTCVPEWQFWLSRHDGTGPFSDNRTWQLADYAMTETAGPLVASAKPTAPNAMVLSLGTRLHGARGRYELTIELVPDPL
jgi:hypothetical protein